MIDKFIRTERIEPEIPLLSGDGTINRGIKISVAINPDIKDITISICRPDSTLAARFVITANHRERNTMFHVYNDMNDDGISFFDNSRSVFRFMFCYNYLHICKIESIDKDFGVEYEDFMNFEQDNIYNLDKFKDKYLDVVIECTGCKIDDRILKIETVRM